VRLGVVLPTYPRGATVEGVAQVAEAAERLGFASVWTTDHVILPQGSAGPYDEILEPLLTLAYIAPLTRQVQLGISVIVVPQRNGVVLAKELATLDRLCGGRLIAGVGAGWSEEEFTMLGVGDRFHHRGKYLDETLRLWNHLWTTPDTPYRSQY
jgi:alkanesulfonate monooxygenase SsuD/methylene tetrahydromethanopterin reductase-like flavin-dependent oxidoreductase (luciferase family)